MGEADQQAIQACWEAWLRSGCRPIILFMQDSDALAAPLPPGTIVVTVVNPRCAAATGSARRGTPLLGLLQVAAQLS